MNTMNKTEYYANRIAYFRLLRNAKMEAELKRRLGFHKFNNYEANEFEKEVKHQLKNIKENK